jgi:hypothetical protein
MNSNSDCFMLLQGEIQVDFKHPLTTWLDLQLLDSQLCSHLECQTWGANHDLQRKVSIGLTNALCCCRQILPWLKILTNYFDDNWLHIVNIAPNFD